MDQIFPRLRSSSSKKVGNENSLFTAQVWVFLSQIIALGILALTPILISRSLLSVSSLNGTQLYTNFHKVLQDTLAFSQEQIVINSLLAYGIAWVYLGCSLWIYYYRRKEPYTPSLAVTLSVGAILLATTSTLLMAQPMVWIWILSLVLAPGLLLVFVHQFPHTHRKASKPSYNFWIGFCASIAFLCVIALTRLGGGANTGFLPFLKTTSLYFTAILVIAEIMLWMKYPALEGNLEKAQLRLVALGIGFSFAPLLLWSILAFRFPTLSISPALLILLPIFPLSATYATTHYNNTHRDIRLKQSIVYWVLTGLVTISFTILIALAWLVVIDIYPESSPLLIILMAFLLVVAINPVRNQVQGWVDKSFHNEINNYPELLQSFARDLARVVDLPSTALLLTRYIHHAFAPKIIHTYTFDSDKTQYCAMPGVNGQPTSDLCFQSSSPLVHTLTEIDRPIYLNKHEKLPNLSLSETARMSLLGGVLYIPLPGQSKLTGFIVIGQRQSGKAYSPEDIGFIDSLSRQIALAIERFEVITHLEHRIREMDVLTRIAQGVNITLEFDDILELIFAQTVNVIPTKDFRITLRSPLDNRSYHALDVEADERLAHNENVNIPQDHGLENIVIQNQRSLVTEDYSKECHLQGVTPDANGIIAWMGVPMNAGGATIGAISLASRDPSVSYTQVHLDLLQAIADQAASAIVKSQLLAEAEKRTRQLNKLNAVARSLTSTLDINLLLNQIMTSAVEILNCEAGSLVMVDEQTGDLVFEVSVGPVASDISGIRLPPGTGVAGKVIQNGEPLIVNDASQNQDWFAQSDKETGFFTRDLLAVPMNVKGAIIGVIEVINKLDGAPFTTDDQEFLSTFTSQAAIAIENARLYTQTDQALSARVGEMSVMQRIDRDLNTTLDVERTMKITLDWSLNQTRADAGFIGIVEKQETDSSKSLRVVATKGFPTNTDDQSQGISINTGTQLQIDEYAGRDDHNSICIPAIITAVLDGKPIQNEFYLEPQIMEETSDLNRSNLFNPEGKILPAARSQVVIPIRRRTDVIALLLLESTKLDNFPEETVTFLSRLSDHAAIALSNAQLYADLQAANIAKSEFVSLVSHELKTPMTSIRGYADLLAQGTVGPINDIQSNFLSTIRSNVNRMSNLVSDLADVSRIEAGRLRLEFGSVSASTIVEEVVRSAQAQLNEKEQVLKLLIPEGLPHIWGDYNRLIQIMNNLLSNAIKYTPDRGQITISADLSDGVENPAAQALHLAVSDTGYGISEEDQIKVFSKFFRSGDPNIREVPGTGLGLNITRHLVEMQGGQIWFESNVGKGTTFHFTIPVSATD